MPRRYLPGHWIRDRKKEKAIHWKGGRTTVNGKYNAVLSPNHPKTNEKVKYILEHIIICESVLGKCLPVNAEIHHANHDGLDNQNRNLVICENRAYHMLLHRREKALRGGQNHNQYLI